MSSFPKKVSRFKSDRSQRDDIPKASPLPPPAPKATILGNIIEIKDTTQIPLGEVSCTTPSGFPSCAPLTGASFSTKPYSSKSKQPTLKHTPKYTQPAEVVRDASSNDFASTNMKRVVNMTEADVQRLEFRCLAVSCTCVILYATFDMLCHCYCCHFVSVHYKK